MSLIARISRHFEESAQLKLAAAEPLILQHQSRGRVHAVVQQEHQTEQALDLGDYWGLVRYADADEPHFRDAAHPWPADPPRGARDQNRSAWKLPLCGHDRTGYL